MKKLLFSVLLLAVSLVNAAEIRVLEAELPHRSFMQARVNAHFYMDMNTHEGFVTVQVTEQVPDFGRSGYCDMDPHGNRCVPHGHPQPNRIQIFSQKVKVDGLMLMGDKVIYHGAEGDVVCGTMGVSRVFKRPTIYLSGKCILSGKIVGRRSNSRVIVDLHTK
jgi:hypothetical protein